MFSQVVKVEGKFAYGTVKKKEDGEYALFGALNLSYLDKKKVWSPEDLKKAADELYEISFKIEELNREVK